MSASSGAPAAGDRNLPLPGTMQSPSRARSRDEISVFDHQPGYTFVSCSRQVSIMSWIAPSAPSQRQITSAALSSDSRIIAVIRAVSYGVSCPPTRARVASRSAASQALMVDSEKVTWSERASPIRLFLARSIRVNEAKPSAPVVTRWAAAWTVLYGSAGRGLGLGVAAAGEAGAARGSGAAGADG